MNLDSISAGVKRISNRYDLEREVLFCGKKERGIYIQYLLLFGRASCTQYHRASYILKYIAFFLSFISSLEYPVLPYFVRLVFFPLTLGGLFVVCFVFYVEGMRNEGMIDLGGVMCWSRF